MEETLPPQSIEVVCIGAGPAGLTAAYLLGKEGISCQVLEQDPRYLGGISRTVCQNGYRIDIGGHRFFSKSEEIEALWDELLGDDFLERPRKSRIFYKRHFFSYPLKAFEALFKLGVFESVKVLCSYGKAQLFPIKPVRSFEDWVSNQFGKRLFQIFFKTYTEKVWGMPCDQISADWAAQRIKGLSLSQAIFSALFPFLNKQKGSSAVKTLISSFRYPRLGPGMMWEAAAQKIKAQGNQVVLNARVESLHFDTLNNAWLLQYRQGETLQTTSCREIISSMPMRELVLSLNPPPPSKVLIAARNLRYRDFLIVALTITEEGDFDDNWIYIHDSSVKVGRIQNFRSWSPELIPEPNKNCYGLEYFCFENDGLWSSSDEQLVELAKREIVKIGLIKESLISGGFVVRQPKAYPVYDEAYKENVAIIRSYLETTYPSLHLVGRNGMHKYNNQDHAMMTAMLTAKNISLGRRDYDVWNVNEDAAYHESGRSTKSKIRERLVPEKLHK